LFGAKSTLRAYNKKTGQCDREIGLGLFTLSVINNEDIISVFNGYYCPTDSVEERKNHTGCMIRISDEVVLDCYSTRGWVCMASLSNSSTGCWNSVTNKQARANAYIHIDSAFVVSLKALRKIKEGEEIICHYGNGYIFPTKSDEDHLADISESDDSYESF
jgi:hypothetical protein